MNQLINNNELDEYKSQLANLFQELQRFATDIDNQELEDAIASLRRNIYEPFLFVVVGEVKAGKSSFINALLQETICQTAAEPCTDIIQQIVYADTASTEEITPYLKKIALPIPILENLCFTHKYPKKDRKEDVAVSK